ncbi:regulator of g protein-signaling 1 [Anaeramoeba flamelloides]|uniref:Regulator of g protein-signaling 1 n=1 Tax=Anaeramoeba flamelloides TaxID=1746091 RepID=A0ABQ8YIU5_9EUKA|nr:regulator of g protein-signaling 1 [Anaeramoeba flamelloides]
MENPPSHKLSGFILPTKKKELKKWIDSLTESIEDRKKRIEQMVFTLNTRKSALYSLKQKASQDLRSFGGMFLLFDNTIESEEDNNEQSEGSTKPTSSRMLITSETNTDDYTVQSDSEMTSSDCHSSEWEEIDAFASTPSSTLIKTKNNTPSKIAKPKDKIFSLSRSPLKNPPVLKKNLKKIIRSKSTTDQRLHQLKKRNGSKESILKRNETSKRSLSFEKKQTIDLNTEYQQFKKEIMRAKTSSRESILKNNDNSLDLNEDFTKTTSSIISYSEEYGMNNQINREKSQKKLLIEFGNSPNKNEFTIKKLTQKTNSNEFTSNQAIEKRQEKKNANNINKTSPNKQKGVGKGKGKENEKRKDNKVNDKRGKKKQKRKKKKKKKRKLKRISSKSPKRMTSKSPKRIPLKSTKMRSDDKYHKQKKQSKIKSQKSTLFGRKKRMSNDLEKKKLNKHSSGTPNEFDDLGILSLNSILNNFFLKFVKFSESEYNDENLLYWQSVNIFKQLFEDGELKKAKKQAKNIFNLYIKNDAAKQINISGKSRNELINIFDNLSNNFPDKNIFNKTQRSIYDMMSNDLYLSFFKTPLYQEIIQEIENEKKLQNNN